MRCAGTMEAFVFVNVCYFLSYEDFQYCSCSAHRALWLLQRRDHGEASSDPCDMGRGIRGSKLVIAGIVFLFFVWFGALQFEPWCIGNRLKVCKYTWMNTFNVKTMNKTNKIFRLKEAQLVKKRLRDDLRPSSDRLC